MGPTNWGVRVPLIYVKSSTAIHLGRWKMDGTIPNGVLSAFSTAMMSANADRKPTSPHVIAVEDMSLIDVAHDYAGHRVTKTSRFALVERWRATGQVVRVYAATMCGPGEPRHNAVHQQMRDIMQHAQRSVSIGYNHCVCLDDEDTRYAQGAPHDIAAWRMW